MLQLKEFSKSYGNHQVIQLTNLTFDTGLIWIKGENGAGKTSLFRSMAGIIPFQGDIAVKDISVKNNPVSFRKLVNYSEAEPSFPGFLTGMDIIQFVGKAKASSIQQKEELLEQLHLQHFYRQSIGSYSSGMLKKLSLILSFLGNPEIIILDEPFTTLDMETRTSLMDLIQQEYNKGKTIFISSHQDFYVPGTTSPITFLVADQTIKKIDHAPQ